MRSVRLAGVAVGLALLVAPSFANAGLLVGDLRAPGDGLLTLDTATSLEWLDLTATVGQSRSSVLSGPFIADGFRYATRSEVNELWDDAGAVGSYGPSNVAPANLLIEQMGCTSQFLGSPCDAPVDPTRGDVQHWNIGFFGTDPLDAGIVDLFLSLHDLRYGNAEMSLDFGTSDGIDILNRPDVGSYLVRSTPLPEPATIALVGTGIAGAVAIRRRKRSASHKSA